jgi:outer membrane usher protein
MAKGISPTHAQQCWHFNVLIHCIGGILLIVCHCTVAREYIFMPSSLEGDVLSQKDIDLSFFSRDNGQLPGVYPSKIAMNKQVIDSATLTYVTGKAGELEAEITPMLLRKWGIRVDAYPKLTSLPEDKPLRDTIGHYIPFATTSFDFNQMTLRISMPQAAIDSASREISPSQWDDGVSVLFADYSFSGTQRQESEHIHSTNQYLNLRSGANLGGWRLRNYSTWSHSDTTHEWQTIGTWFEHDIDVLRAQFTAGENSTRGEVFDSIQYDGVNLVSDDAMLPFNQRGFAPVIRGIASSNAEVSVRQNGYLIYQANVAPGPFELKDLYSTTNSGDLEITVKEADGTTHQFVQPYSSVALMQRPGQTRYEFTAARYHADSSQNSLTPLFFQGSAIYGLNNFLTLYGGTTTAENYLAGSAGVGTVLGSWGSLSSDVTWARSQLDNNTQAVGQSWRVTYSGMFEPTDTNFTVASYRYSTRGYYSFPDANQKYDSNNADTFLYNKRSRIQISISQSVLGGSLYLNGYKQNYWNSSRTEKNVSAGLSENIDGINYHLSWTWSSMDDSADSDRMVSFGVSIPLSRWLPKSWATYNISNARGGSTNQNMGLSGTLLDDDKLSYSLQQSQSNNDGSNTSSLYGSYRSQYANINAGYYFGSDKTQQLSYGMSGAVVAHPRGVTLSQPLGNEFAIVNTEGAQGVRFKNHRSVQTDWFGNAIIPSLTPYQENTLRIDTTTLPKDVDTNDTATTLIPSHSAAVNAHFTTHIGYRVLITLARPGGKVVPFGATATIQEAPLNGIVDDGGTLYLAGVGDNFTVNAKWGNAPDQQCQATANIPESQKNTNLTGIYTINALCTEAPHGRSR